MSSFLSQSPVCSKSQRGFTLIELLVVVSIMLIISTILLVRQQQFNSSTLLRSLGYSVALSIHQAQVYGVSIKQDTAGGFAPAYGIYVNQNDPSQYILFADTTGAGEYIVGSSENIKTFTLNTGYSVQNVCANSDCWNNGKISWVTIIFRRPNPEACFATSANPTACATGSVSPYTSAYIQLASRGGSTRGVSISSTGEITVATSTGS